MLVKFFCGFFKRTQKNHIRSAYGILQDCWHMKPDILFEAHWWQESKREDQGEDGLMMSKIRWGDCHGMHMDGAKRELEKRLERNDVIVSSHWCSFTKLAIWVSVMPRWPQTWQNDYTDICRYLTSIEKLMSSQLSLPWKINEVYIHISKSVCWL